MKPSEMPSQNRSEPWVWAYAKQSGTPRDENVSTVEVESAAMPGGKWLVYLSTGIVDRVWREYASATERGRLGSVCKCSTVMFPDAVGRPNIHVIVVYTEDREDDIRRVLRALRTELRVRQVLSYKTNAATAANEYGPGAAKYVSPAGSLDMELRRT
jgi:hypothetical protein